MNHDILLSIMKSYLSDRTQCVKIGGSASKYALITCGNPQGSVLGPLLFLVFINDIHKSDSEGSFHVFADNTSLSFADKNIRRLEAKSNTSLKNITNQLKANKLTLNIDKLQLVFFYLSPSTSKADALNIQINSQKLEQ